MYVPTKLAIFVGDGIGDALFIVPLLHYALAQKYEITVIFNSAQANHVIFSCFSLPVTQIVLGNNKHQWGHLVKTYYRYFDLCLLSNAAERMANIGLGLLIAKKTISYRSLSLLEAIFQKSYIVKLPFEGHIIQHNIALLSDEATQQWHRFMHIQPLLTNSTITTALPIQYVVVQVASANNVFQYKNWTSQGWQSLFEWIYKEFSTTNFVFIGEAQEQHYIQSIAALPTCINLLGKTTMQEAATIVAKAQAYIGLDSGFLHWAVLCDLPTFSLWGGTDATRSGYVCLNPEKHWAVFKHFACAPCEDPFTPNRTRVRHATQCPDYACLRTLSPLVVYEQLILFLQKYAINKS